MPHKYAQGVRGRLLSGLDNLVVAAPDPSGELSRCWCFQVMPGGWDHLQQRPLRPRDTNGALRGPVTAGSGIDYTPLYDSNGDDVLRVPNNDEMFIYHISVAVQEDHVRVYPRVPPTREHGGFRYLTANQPDPTAGDNFGYVLGRDMDFDNPPRVLEQVAWESGSNNESNVEFGFYNEDPDEQTTVRMNVYGRSYMLSPYENQTVKRKIVSGKIPRTVVKLGTITNSFEPGVPNDW